jgi:hypothetical protein
VQRRLQGSTILAAIMSAGVIRLVFRALVAQIILGENFYFNGLPLCAPRFLLSFVTSAGSCSCPHRGQTTLVLCLAMSRKKAVKACPQFLQTKLTLFFFNCDFKSCSAKTGMLHLVRYCHATLRINLPRVFPFSLSSCASLACARLIAPPKRGLRCP